MENWFWLYLLTRLDAIQVLFAVGVVIFSIAIVVSLFTYSESYCSDEKKKIVKYIKVAGSAVAVFLMLGTLTPSTKDMMFIVGGSTLLEISKTEDAKRIAGKSVKAVEQWLDKNLEKEISK